MYWSAVGICNNSERKLFKHTSINVSLLIHPKLTSVFVDEWTQHLFWWQLEECMCKWVGWWGLEKCMSCLWQKILQDKANLLRIKKAQATNRWREMGRVQKRRWRSCTEMQKREKICEDLYRDRKKIKRYTENIWRLARAEKKEWR